MDPHRPLKILVSAYACHPSMGSEPGMGWNWIKSLALASKHELWVLTEAERFAPAMVSALKDEPALAARIHVIGVSRKRFAEKCFPKVFYYFTYRLWQKAAYVKALELCAQVQFDVVHQLNMIGYREPGYLWKLDLPFVWGPIGGHAQMPWRFLPLLGYRGAVEHFLRNVVNKIQMWSSVRVRKAMRRGNVLIAATNDDLKCIARIHGRKAILVNETGVDSVQGNQKERHDNEVLKLVWCGIFVSRKALPLVLRAVRRVATTGNIELHILGAGPFEVAWKRLADELEVDRVCRWYGMVSHGEVKEILLNCDVFLLSSLQEATSTVVMEALQAGLPVICHDMCGFGAVVDDTCGIKIPVKSPGESILGFAKAIVSLHKNPDKLHQLSLGAMKKASQNEWGRKAEIMDELYFETISSFNKDKN